MDHHLHPLRKEVDLRHQLRHSHSEGRQGKCGLTAKPSAHAKASEFLGFGDYPNRKDPTQGADVLSMLPLARGL